MAQIVKKCYPKSSLLYVSSLQYIKNPFVVSHISLEILSSNLSSIKISVHRMLRVKSLLVGCLFWSSFSSFAELFKDHWSVQVYNKCICIFSAREHRFLPHWRLVRILSYHNGPRDISRTTHFYSPNWCTEGHIPDQKSFLGAQCHPFSYGVFVSPFSSWASVSSWSRVAR